MASAKEVDQEQVEEEQLAFLLRRRGELENANEQWKRMSLLQSKIQEDKRQVFEELSNRENTIRRAVTSICKDINDYMCSVQEFQGKLGAYTACYTIPKDYTPNVATMASCVEEISNMTQEARVALGKANSDWRDANENAEMLMGRATQTIMYKILGKVDPNEPKAID